MNFSLTDSTWTAKALLIAGAVALMLVGAETYSAAPEQAQAASTGAQWVQYEAPSVPQTIVRPASSTVQGKQFNGGGQQRWVF